MKYKRERQAGECSASGCHAESTVIVALSAGADRLEYCDRHWVVRCDQQTEELGGAA